MKEERNKVTLGIVLGLIMIVFLPINMIIRDTKAQPSATEKLVEQIPEQPQLDDIDRTLSYIDGAGDIQGMLMLDKEVIELFKSRELSFEQTCEYMECSEAIRDCLLSDEEIPLEKVEKYNNLLKTIEAEKYIDGLKTGDDYMRGFKDWYICYAYSQIINFYENEIPEWETQRFRDVVYENIYLYETEEDILKIVDYGRYIVDLYIGEPNEVLRSGDWRSDRFLLQRTKQPE